MSGQEHCEDERPRAARFSIFGHIQPQQRVRDSYSPSNDQFPHLSIKAENYDDRYHDDADDDMEADGEDQPLDFSAKKSEPKITAKVAVRPSNVHNGHLPWGLSVPSHSSESGVSDLCSSSPHSDVDHPAPAKSPLGGSPPQRDVPTPQRSAQIPSPGLPAALNAIYAPLAALQNARSPVTGLDPAITAATTQLLTNLAAVTNGGKAGKNTRPFKAYPRDPMSLPLGLYGLPLAASGAGGDEAVLGTTSNDAYAEFRRQMLSQVQAAKSKRKSANANGNSRPNSVSGNDDDNNSLHGNGHDSDVQEGTHIRGTVSVTDLRLVNGHEDDSEHSASDSAHVPTVKSPNNYSTQSNTSPNSMGTPGSAANQMTNGSASKKRGRNGEEIKDEAYWERRRKNNEAAKRSRDARRAKEDEIAIRAAFLEQENLKLRFELANLKNETAKLRCMIYNS